MKGLQVKSLLRRYQNCFDEKSVIDFLSLPEQVLYCLDESKDSGEDNLVIPERNECLMRLAFTQFTTLQLINILEKAKKLSIDDLRIYTEIIEAISNMPNDARRESCKSQVLYFFLISCDGKIPAFGELPTYLDAMDSDESFKPNIAFVEGSEDAEHIRNIMHLKAKISTRLDGVARDKFDLDLIELIDLKSIKKDEKEREESKKCLSVLLKYESVLREITYADSSTTNTVFSKILSIACDGDDERLSLYLETLRRFPRLYSEIVEFISTEFASEAESEKSFYRRVIMICSASGESFSLDSLKTIAKITEEQAKKITILLSYREVPRSFDFEMLLDPVNLARIDELKKLIDEGEVSAYSILSGEQSLFNCLNYAVMQDAHKEFEELVDSIPDDANITKDTISFKLTNKKK